MAAEHWSDHHLMPPETTLSVDDAVALAKAGVKIELRHPVQIITGEPQPPPRPPDREDISQGIRDRMWQNLRIATPQHHYIGETVPILYAVMHGNEVHVFVAPRTTTPEIIVDDAAIYPSDALLARIRLLMEHGSDKKQA